MNDRLSIVGTGRLGLALGYALHGVGAVEDLTYLGRQPEPPAHPLFDKGIACYVYGMEALGEGTTAVFLAVPDDAVLEVAVHLAAQGPAPDGCAAFHLSGTLTTEPLEALRLKGYDVGTLHPLQTFANPVGGAELFDGVTCAISGGAGALTIGRRLLGALGASPVTIPVSQRPVYHVAAVFASNYLATLVSMSGRLLVRAGVSEDEALPALLPLIRGALENMEMLGLEKSLTGPVVRGDLETLRLHLRALDPREKQLYLALGRELACMASEAGRLDEESYVDMMEVFSK